MTTETAPAVIDARTAADASLDALAAGARRWADRGLAERRRLLLATHRTVGDAAADWVRGACAIKGIDDRLAGEEWLSGPYAALTALVAYADTLHALDGGHSPVDGFGLVDARGGPAAAVRPPGRRVVPARCR